MFRLTFLLVTVLLLLAACTAGQESQSTDSTVDEVKPVLRTKNLAVIPNEITNPPGSDQATLFPTLTPAISSTPRPPGSATTQNKFTRHEFTARVGNVRLQSQLIESGKSNEDLVTVSVSAILYPEPIVIEDVRTVSTPNLPEEVNFLVGYTKVNLEGSPEEIAAFWAPSVRVEKMETIGKYYEKNREIVAKHPGLTVLAIVKHGDDTRSVITQLSQEVAIGVTMFEEDGRLYLMNEPENDLELAIIEASFHN